MITMATKKREKGQKVKRGLETLFLLSIQQTALRKSLFFCVLSPCLEKEKKKKDNVTDSLFIFLFFCS